MDKLKITSGLLLLTLMFTSTCTIAADKAEAFEICKMNARADRVFMTDRQEGVPLLDAMEAERERIAEKVRINNIPKPVQEVFTNLTMGQIAEAYDRPVGYNEERKKEIIEEYVNSRLSKCIRYANKMK
nr:hypothetical protein 3 [Gammaproteobacteria bacterium]